eukprot:scaffold399514_cov40-Prasinocladus_malaysianus.AAC.1
MTNRLTSLILAPFLVAQFVFEFIASLRFQDSWRPEICGDNVLCHSGYRLQTLLLTLNANLLLLSTMSVQTMPACLWSAPMLVAARRTGKVRVQRLQWLPLLGGGSYILYFLAITHQQTRMIQKDAGELEAAVFFITLLACTIYNLMLFWIAMVPHDILSLFTGRKTNATQKIVPSLDEASVTSRLSTAQLSLTPHTTKRAAPAVRYLRGLWARLQRVTGLSEFGSRSQQEALLGIQLILWSDRMISAASTGES